MTDLQKKKINLVEKIDNGIKCVSTLENEELQDVYATFHLFFSNGEPSLFGFTLNIGENGNVYKADMGDLPPTIQYLVLKSVMEGDE